MKRRARTALAGKGILLQNPKNRKAINIVRQIAQKNLSNLPGKNLALALSPLLQHIMYLTLSHPFPCTVSMIL